MGQLYSRQSWRGGCVTTVTPSFEPFRLGHAAVVYTKDLSDMYYYDAWQLVSFLTAGEHDALLRRQQVC